jgi:hypothetical protein
MTEVDTIADTSCYAPRCYGYCLLLWLVVEATASVAAMVAVTSIACPRCSILWLGINIIACSRCHDLLKLRHDVAVAAMAAFCMMSLLNYGLRFDLTLIL